MSSLSNQPTGSPFSEYSELCTVPSLSPSGAPQSWDWQHGDMGMGPRDNGGGVGAQRGPAGLTDKDKLCFFDPPGAGALDAELKVPGRTGIPGSTSLGNASLGSTAESPESPLSSSPSPSPASPGRLPSALGCGNYGAPLPPAPVPSASLMDLPARPSPTQASPTPAGAWSPGFTESNPKAAPRTAANYCVVGVVNDDYLERGDKSAPPAPGGRQRAEGSSEESGDDAEGAEELAPCFMGRAEQQRKAMRRAMSECSHLSVPASLELPDAYPGGGGGGGVDEFTSSVRGPRPPPHSMKRSLTVAEEQPCPTLSASGATRSDLTQDPPEPRLSLSPFPPLKGLPASVPLLPGKGVVEDVEADQELGGVLLPVPASPRGFSSTGAGGTALGTGFGTGVAADFSVCAGSPLGKAMSSHPSFNSSTNPFIAAAEGR
ncbi:uncharacterized protein FYW47_001701 [Aplochiton taeniatus]